MSFNAKQLPNNTSNKKQADPLEQGGYPARLVQMVIMGVQASPPFKGEDKPPRLMVRFTYELLDEFLKDENGEDQLDKPRWLSEEIAFLSLKADLATSTKRYYALDPEDKADGDWSLLIGTPCILSVVVERSKKDDRVFNKISNVSAMRPKEAAKAPPLVNPSLAWDFYNPDVEVFKTFPEWIQNRIKGALDYPGSALETALGEGKDNQGVSKGSKHKKAPVAPPDEPEGDEEEEQW